MAYFSELDEILTNIVGNKILTNQDLCKLLSCYSDTNNPSYNPLDEPDIQNPRELLMKNVFPMPKSPDAQTDQTGFLTVVLSGANNPYGDNMGYRHMFLVFDIIVHLKQWLIQGSYRVYKIAEEIDKMINYQVTDLPIEGKPIYVDFKQRDYSNSFYGIQLVYDVIVNSNLTCDPVPSNAKINMPTTLFTRGNNGE